MKITRDYFDYLLSILLPEVYPEQLSVTPFKSTSELNHLCCVYRKQARAKLLFLRNHESSERISIGEHPEFFVKTNIETAKRIGNALALNTTQLVDLAVFASSKIPAILFDKEDDILYFLFDLEKLICKIAKLDDELDVVDRHGRFTAEFHKEESRWKFPIIEIIGRCMRQSLKLSEPTKKYGIIMTHDVDRVGRDFLLLIKKVINNEILPLSLHPAKDSVFDSIKNLIDIDSQNGIPSVWFFLSGSYSLRRYGNRYNSYNRKTKSLIADIRQKNHSIGLHTSYYNAFNKDKCYQEKVNLEKLYNRPVLVNRNHYLRFNAKISVDLLENCGFKADASMGFPDANGFRSGLCRPFRPWNHNRQRISQILEIPLIFMDSVNRHDLEKSWDDFVRGINWVKDVKGCATVLFHPCSIALNAEMYQFYLSAIKELKRLNIPFLSLDEVLTKSMQF